MIMLMVLFVVIFISLLVIVRVFVLWFVLCIELKYLAGLILCGVKMKVDGIRKLLVELGLLRLKLIELL